MPSVTVAIPTYRRPHGLRRLLAALQDSATDAAVRVLVVDNDMDGEGAALCAALAPSYRWPLRAVIEAQKGITFARNRLAAEMAANPPDYVAMIDDDEWPDAHWVQRLVEAAERYGADMVMGPSLPHFEGKAPDWAARGGFYDALTLPSGPTDAVVGTNNLLVRWPTLARYLPEPFPNSYADYGGSDSAFMKRAKRDGAKTAWASDAIAYEEYGPDRVRKEWLRWRAFRKGGASYITDTTLRPGAANQIRRVGRAGLKLAGGAAAWLAGVASEPGRLRGELEMLDALGRFSAAFGWRYAEYKRATGR